MALSDRLPLEAGKVGAVVGFAIPIWFTLFAINENIWNWLLFAQFRLDPTNPIVESIRFFVYDSIKIFLLLAGIIFVTTVARSFMSIERTRALLGGKRAGLGNVAAAALGIVTPFCSCSAVPAFIGFVSAGIPVGVTMSFLIASPLINEIAIGLLWSLFGWEIALMYVAAGLTIAIVAGFVIGLMKPERWVESFVFETRIGGQIVDPSRGLSFRERVQMGVEETQSILRKVWIYVLVGIAIGAVIHGWAPADFFAAVAGPDNPFAVVIAVVMGIPLYSNAAGVMPIVEVLFTAGIPMGTLLAFMMAVVALSLPELVLLKRILKMPLLGIFVAVVASGIVVIGYSFNAIVGG